ncbi:glycosyl transferase, group 1 family protein [Indibacter alkaliphilus LW1]|uniref:Glycosyl transferase, group 1 family protein n=1 Tax=Indibacter alkaliphilus (strain CCUG 57479 / KCTC 22604 / LW1) TaxID=1189612 RepID=S2DP70_INDAL|nr:glycosyltransferase [Indibacter alkaliphilus]EOZ93766.1 glycosyl transferase, group 1 family protein [Indibacter alkaliphilus LW1]
MSEKIRILHCIETISSGGVERLRLSFARNLDYNKYELKIACTQAKGQILKEFKTLGVEIIEVGNFKHPFQLKNYNILLKHIKSYQPHIIHGAVFEGNSMATVGKIFGKVPVAILEETSEPRFRSKKANFLLKCYANFADIFVGISPAVVTYLKSTLNLSSSKVILLSNGVEVPEAVRSETLSKLKDSLGINSDDIVIGAVGRVYDKVKRFSDIIEAIHLLGNPKLKFLLIGNGPDLEYLKSLTHKYSLEGQVLFLDYQADPNPYYCLMDIFCLPSLQEGFGLVVVEAMLHNLPVIATKVGGLKNIVDDGKSGYLVNPQSSIELASKLNYLIQNPDLRDQMGRVGYQRAIENFTIDTYTSNLLQLYHEKLTKKATHN